MYKKPKVYDTTYNAELNVTKEGTSVEEELLESVKVYNGKDKINEMLKLNLISLISEMLYLIKHIT